MQVSCLKKTNLTLGQLRRGPWIIFFGLESTSQRANYALILQASLNAPFFVWWVSLSPRTGHFTTHPKLSKYFKRSKERYFWSKIPVIVGPNFEIGAKHSVPCVMFLFYHWIMCGKFLYVRPHGLKDHAPKRFSSRPSFAGLFRATQAHCGVASIS